MSELLGFPHLNQLDLWDTTDGRISESSQFLCVPASIAAGLQYLTGRHYSPDALKDVAYGEGWVNQPTSIERFIPYCLTAGVSLRKLPAVSYYAAVALAHTVLARGNPVLFTQQDDYAPKEPTWTHVCVWYKDTSDTLTAMDPYGGKSLTFDNLTWAARMRSRDLWVMEKITTMKFDALGWLDAAIEIDALNKSMDRAGQKPVIIVLHGTAGFNTAQDVGTYFATSTVDASTHFVVGKDGAIIQCVNVAAASWGNGGLTAGHRPFLPGNVNPNLYTISIEHVKNHKNAAGQYDNQDTLTDAQRAASFRLIDALCTHYGIPRKVATDMAGGILGHHDIDPVNRPNCPGPYPLDELLAYLKGGTPTVDALTRYNTNGHLKQELDDCWKSLIPTLPTGSGIWKSWLSLWLDRGIQAGPPLKGEYSTVNGNGEVIRVLECAHLRCEWDSHSVARWYGASPGAI